MTKIEVYILERINEELKKRKWTKKYFGINILGWGKTKAYDKLGGKSRFDFEDLELISQGLDIIQTELFPSKLKYDIEKIPLIELIRFIARDEIGEYLKENNTKKSK